VIFIFTSLFPNVGWADQSYYRNPEVRKGGYYVSTVGLNEATIRKYIQDQERADIIQDKLSVKEYEDPFKGQGK
jgi:hypothetical protein